MNDRKNKTKPSKTVGSQTRHEITLLYQNARNGTDLTAALHARHYELVKSTRGKLFVIDRKGEEYNLIFCIAAPREEVEKKLADINPASLPLKKSRERDTCVKCFVSLSEKARIEASAEQAELSVSGYLRAKIFGKNTPQPKGSWRPTSHKQSLVNLYAELDRIGIHMKQIEQLTKGRFFESSITDSCKSKYSALLDTINAALINPLTKKSSRNNEKLIDSTTELIRIGKMINQIAKQLNPGQDFESEFLLTTYMQLDTVLNTLIDALKGADK